MSKLGELENTTLDTALKDVCDALKQMNTKESLEYCEKVSCFNEKVKDFNIRSKESGSRLSAKESMDLMNEQMNLMIGAMKFC